MLHYMNITYLVQLYISHGQTLSQGLIMWQLYGRSIWNWVKNNNNNNAIIIAAAVVVVVVVVCNLYSMTVVVVTKMIDDDSDDHMVLMSCHTLMIQKICYYLQIYLVMIFWSERHNGDVHRSWGASLYDIEKGMFIVFSGTLKREVWIIHVLWFKMVI
jgi:hypothetical protein